MTKFLILSLFFFIATPAFLLAQNIKTRGEVYDGTAYDIAPGNDVIYLAQGRYLAIINPETGLRSSNFNDSPYPDQLVAVEFDKLSNMLFAATGKHIYIYDIPNNTTKIWHNESDKSITDFKCIFQDQRLLVIVFNKVLIIDYSIDIPIKISEFSTPDGILFYNRIHIADTRKGKMAYLTGAISGQQIRGINGLIIAKLDSENNYALPTIYPDVWNPVAHYSSSAASVRNVQVLENYNNQYTCAFVACGHLGQLTVLDVTDPSSVKFVAQKVLADGFAVHNVLLDEDSTRLFAASTNILHSLDILSLNVLGSRNAGFFDAGDRDMILHLYNDRKYLWTATHFSVDYVINAVDVTTNQLTHPLKQWWISSSDGAVAVSQWNAVYLPTFGGIVRYDVSDEANPVAVNESYQPAGGTIEHIDIIFPDPNDQNHALLLTSPGNGGVQFWEVSSANPNPGPPVKVVQNPAHWGNDHVYQNDVGHFRKDDVNYFLADLANRSTHEVALQIYNTSTGNWISVIEQSEHLKSNSHTVAVSHEYAFVTCQGGFFVVDLSQLPNSASLTDVVVNDWNNDGKPDNVAAIVISEDGNFVFIAHDPGVIQSFRFNKVTGKVSGPIDQLYGDSISGSTSRGRYYDPLKRFYIAGRGGNIMEIDANDPNNLKLLSVWNNGAYQGEMQDCRIYDFGNGPRLLAVKNNEAFALLEIETNPPEDEELKKNLVAHWTFDNETAGKVQDKTSNNLHGTAYNVSYENGPVSRAVVFNGVDSRIYFPDIHINPPDTIGDLAVGSISLWFKFISTGADIIPILYFGESDSNSPHNSLIIEIGHSKDILDRRLYFTIVNRKFCYDSRKNLDDNTWYHFVAVVGPEGNTGYLNGEEMTDRRYNLGSDASYSDFFANVPVRKLLSLGYGRYGREKPFFTMKGSMDDVRIYNRPLSKSDVQKLYALGSQVDVNNPAFKSSGIHIYPNPISPDSQLKVDFNLTMPGTYQVSIYNMIGQRCFIDKSYHLPSGQQSILLETDGLSEGIYFIQIGGKDKMETGRFVVVR